mgnify:CR=1 FL=1
MAKPTRVPGIPKPPSDVSPGLRGWLSSVAEALEIRLGRRGDPKDRAVTLRELIDSGLARDLKSAPFDPNNPNNSNIGFSPNTVVDSTVPPQPTSFSAAAAYSQVILGWDYPNYSNHSFTEIYGHDSDVIGDAQLIGVSTGRVYIDPIGGGASRYYWIRHVSTSSVLGPWNSGTGTLAQTATDTATLLAELEGSIPAVAFASGIEPISVVNFLPTVSGYTGPSVVLLSTDGKLYRLVNGAWTAAVPTTDLSGTIATLQLADDAVTNAKIAVDAIQGDVIAASAITADKILSGAVTSLKLADDAVTSAKIATNAIQGDVIAAGAITNTKVSDGAIETAKIAANAITSAKINAGAVTASEIASNAITSAKIQAGAVTASEIASNAITAAKISAGAIETEKLAANAITAAKIAAGAVTANEIASNAITSAKISAGAVTANEIASNAITAVKISADAVTANKIATNAVTADAVAAGAITAGAISAGAINASNIIADGVIVGNKIAANAITSAKIQAGAVNADKISAGAITGDKISSNTIDASKINIDGATLTASSSGALQVGEIAANSITSGTLDASQITVTNLTAGQIDGDINEMVTFSQTQDVQLGAGATDTVVWRGELPATNFARRPYCIVNGWGLFENDHTYKLTLQMKVHQNLTSSLTVGSASQYSWTYSGFTFYYVTLFIDGDVAASCPANSEVRKNGVLLGTVFSASYSTATGKTSVTMLFSSTPQQNSYYVGSISVTTGAPVWQDVSSIFMRSNHDYHAEPFTLVGGLNSYQAAKVEMKVISNHYLSSQYYEPTYQVANNWTHDEINQIDGFMMEIR